MHYTLHILLLGKFLNAIIFTMSINILILSLYPAKNTIFNHVTVIDIL